MVSTTRLTSYSCYSQVHPWVTRHGAEPLPPEDDNCCVLIEVTEEEVENSVKHVPSLATVVRLKKKKENFSSDE